MKKIRREPDERLNRVPLLREGMLTLRNWSLPQLSRNNTKKRLRKNDNKKNREISKQ